MATDPARVKALFHAAIERPDPAERRTFLDAEAGGDAELRARLDALLEAFDRPPGALERPLVADHEATAAVDPGTGDAPVGPPGPTHAGRPTVGYRPADGPGLNDAVIADRYKLRQEIGEGGMGTVYLAEQVRPVRRMVALKLIKPGMDSRSVLARFDTERQALALMDHPNVAKVLDAGTTSQGRPFFVMELVKGVPITEYCDQHRLGIPERLAIFRQVCSAVQHAHQKGIIHRDLKPSNILIESHDGRPVPKVIDFGLAKATSGLKLTDQSLFTAFGSVTGTPLYMAPEQATFNALDVDTRADIYALGVVLYELLTGSTPIARGSLRRAALDEMLRVIREVEPPTPSSRISTSEGLPGLAAARHIEPSRLCRFIRGDLDWIVMKSLAKERERRYASAIDLANDVERHLNHEPVSAGPPTATYRVRKFVRRHRGRVAAAALVLLALVLGMVGTALGLLEARRQEMHAIAAAKAADDARQAESLQRAAAIRLGQIAHEEAVQKEEARKSEAIQRERAEKRLGQVARMNDILGSIFEGLDPRKVERGGRPLAALLGERLDRATEELEGEATGDPLAVARMQMTLGESQLALGYAIKAIALYTRARSTFVARLGPDHPETLKSIDGLARSLSEAGRGEQAFGLREKVLEHRKSRLGPDHPDTLRSMSDLALGHAQAGRPDLSIQLLEKAVEGQKRVLGPDHPDTLASLLTLSGRYADRGLKAESLRLREGVLQVMTARLGVDHLDTIAAMNHLSSSYAEDRQLRRAIELQEKALELRKAKLGPDHPDTIASLVDLAARYAQDGRPGRALVLREEALARRREKLGPDHPDTIASMRLLADSYAAGQPDRARQLREEAAAMELARVSPERTFETAPQVEAMPVGSKPIQIGPNPNDTLPNRDGLARDYAASGQIDRSFKVQEETLEWCRAKLGAEHPDTLDGMNNLALAYREAGRLDRTLALQEEVLKIRRAKLGPQHPATIRTMNDLAINYANAGREDREKKLREEIRALVLPRTDVIANPTPGAMFPAVPATGPMPAQPDVAGGKMSEALSFERRGEYDRAEVLWNEAISARRKAQGEDHPETLFLMNHLAQVYREAGKLDLALSLWREVLGIRKRRAEADPVAYAGALAGLGFGLVDAKDWAGAEPVLRECLAIREAKRPDEWRTFDTRSVLGAALLGQGRTAEAEPLLRSGYEGMAKRADKIPAQGKARLAEALDRLIGFGEAAGKAEEVKAWKEERAKLPAGPPKPGAGAR